MFLLRHKTCQHVPNNLVWQALPILVTKFCLSLADEFLWHFVDALTQVVPDPCGGSQRQNLAYADGKNSAKPNVLCRGYELLLMWLP